MGCRTSSPRDSLEESQDHRKYILFQELQLIRFAHNAPGSQSSGFLGNLLKGQSVFIMKAESTEPPKAVWGI